MGLKLKFQGKCIRKDRILATDFWTEVYVAPWYDCWLPTQTGLGRLIDNMAVLTFVKPNLVVSV